MSAQSSKSKSEKPPPGWTTTPPTEPGFYWLREQGEGTSIVEVSRYRNTKELRAAFPGSEAELPFGSKNLHYPDIADGSEWFGPLTPPG